MVPLLAFVPLLLLSLASALEGIGGSSSNVELQSAATPLLVNANFNGFVYGTDPDPSNQFVAQVQTAMVKFIFGSDNDVSLSTPRPHGTYTSCVVTPKFTDVPNLYYFQQMIELYPTWVWSMQNGFNSTAYGTANVSGTAILGVVSSDDLQSNDDDNLWVSLIQINVVTHIHTIHLHSPLYTSRTTSHIKFLTLYLH